MFTRVTYFSDLLTAAYLFVIGGANSIATNVYLVEHGNITWLCRGPDLDTKYEWTEAGFTTMGSDIVMAGGYTWGQTSIQIQPRVVTYKTKHRVFDEMKLMRIARNSPAMFSLEGRVYAVGGCMPKELKSWKMEYTNLQVNMNKGRKTWIYSNVELPFDVCYSSAVVVNGAVYICSSGGSSLRRNIIPHTIKSRKSVIMWKPGMLEWKSLEEMHIARQLHCTLTNSLDTIWVVGSCQGDCWHDGFIEQYSIANNRWQKLKTAPPLREDETQDYHINFCIYWDDHIYITFFKGKAHEPEIHPLVHVYNTCTGQWHKSNTTVQSKTTFSVVSVIPVNRSSPVSHSCLPSQPPSDKHSNL